MSVGRKPLRELELWRTLRTNPVSVSALLEWFGIHAPPVPVLGIAQGLGIKVYYRQGAGQDGLLNLRAGEGAYLFIKEELSPRHKRWAIAVGLAFLMGGPRDQLVYRFDTSQIELDPEYAGIRATALSLLVPQWMFDFAKGSYMKLSFPQTSDLFEVEAPLIGAAARAYKWL